jgi:two-component system phosphate regulon sensor histidine kinase PhoR
LKQLREDPSTRDILVIILTGARKDSASIERGFALGVNEFLSKPIDMDELFVRLNALLKLRKTENDLEEMRRTYFSMIVHDLRSPLSSINLASEIAGDEALPPAAREMVGMIGETSQELLGLVNNILEISRWETVKFSLNKEPVDLAALVINGSDQLSPLADKAKIDYRYVVEPDLPKVPLDAGKMRQVVINILHNAIKFSPANSTIRILVFKKEDYLGFEVTDQGIGIPEEKMVTIFNVQKKRDNRKRHEAEGTGLGLPICKHIVDAHGGTITISSTEGKGTSIKVMLPLKEKSSLA